VKRTYLNDQGFGCHDAGFGEVRGLEAFSVARAP
jgi:hypothetical protein